MLSKLFSGKAYLLPAVIMGMVIILCSVATSIYIDYKLGNQRFVHAHVVMRALAQESFADKPEHINDIKYLNNIAQATLASQIMICDANNEIVRQFSVSDRPIPEKIMQRLEMALAGSDPAPYWYNPDEFVIAQPIFGKSDDYQGTIAFYFDYKTISGMDEHIRRLLLCVFLPMLVLLMIYLWQRDKRNQKRIFDLTVAGLQARMDEQLLILESLDDAVFVANKLGEISYINSKARELLLKGGINIEMGNNNLSITDLFPELELEMIKFVALRNKELIWRGRSLLMSTEHIVHNEQLAGIRLIMKEMTVVKALAEELTGVKTYANTLRTQTHEFMNKLFTISGLLQLQQYNKAQEYLFSLSQLYQTDIANITAKIKPPALAGLFLGKLSQGRELDVELEISDNSFFPLIEDNEYIHDISIICGNIIDNAFEAMRGQASAKIKVAFFAKDDFLTIQIDDSGPGIADNKLDKIFERGYSSKGERRGIGLSLVQEIVRSRLGHLEVLSVIGEGSSFLLEIPLPVIKFREVKYYD